MSRHQFIKHIKSLNQEELILELKEIYSRFKAVQKYYSLELGDDKERKKIYAKAKKDVSKLYLIRGLHRKRPRVQKLNSLFAELKKNSIFSYEMIDVYLHSVKHGVVFFRDTRRSSEPVKNHIVRCFSAACKLIKENILEEKYHHVVNEILILSEALYFVGRELRTIADTELN